MPAVGTRADDVPGRWTRTPARSPERIVRALALVGLAGLCGATAFGAAHARAADGGADEIAHDLADGNEGTDLAFGCLAGGNAALATVRFGLEGRCLPGDADTDCAYHDLRDAELADGAGLDQRGVAAHQVTFPGDEHLWGAASIREPAGHRFCWVGGAVIGRNPLAMTWAGESGSKMRKNNFLLTQGGRAVVEGVRVHNVHDALMAESPDAGFDVRHSWFSWNRDDFFEGYLHDLRMDDVLVDGTFAFVSDPDGECDGDKVARDSTVVIENSLIRLQRMPGPYSRYTERWHAEPEGGHNVLWKLDSCGWSEWPTFVLRNNVFLIEGPRTTSWELHRTDCHLALPGACEGAVPLANLVECTDNLFLYTDYRRWRDAGTEPGPVPQPGDAFHDADNPDFLPDGEGCYQRLTDDPRDPGHADVRAIWRGLRARWIERHTAEAPASVRLMRVPGVDFAPFESGTRVTLASRLDGRCLTSPADGVPVPRPCDGSAGQRFTVVAFDDGVLPGALLLEDSRGRYLRSPPPPVDGGAVEGGGPHWPVLAEAAVGGEPAFAERWYLLPLDELGGADPGDGNGGTPFALESDVIGRSFVRDAGETIAVQSLRADGAHTPLPQPRFAHGDDPALQWRVRRVEAGG